MSKLHCHVSKTLGLSSYALGTSTCIRRYSSFCGASPSLAFQRRSPSPVNKISTHTERASRPSSTMSPMSPNALRDAFNPSVFEAVRKLWFQNAADETQLILPPQELSKQWFTSDAAFDKLCLFVPVLFCFPVGKATDAICYLGMRFVNSSASSRAAP